MKKRLDLLGLTQGNQAGSYIMILKDEEDKRRMPIIIGEFEAKALAICLENVKPSRPLSHDLFKKLSEAFNIQVKEVMITDVQEGIFCAKIICRQNEKHFEIDSRTSDAIILALKFKCPIFVEESVFYGYSIDINDINDIKEAQQRKTEEKIKEEKIKKTEKKKANDLKNLPTEELIQMLEEAIMNEEYEKAAKIRDELRSRQFKTC